MLATVVCVVFLLICLREQESLEIRFDAIINWLSNIERAVAGLDTHLILLCIFALWLAKCQLPIPISFLCVISGMVFSIQTALIINVACIMVFFVIKYFEGRWIGGGWAMMILNIHQAKFVKNWVQFKGSGNPYILVVSRFVPSIPLGMVSKLYGSMHYDFVYYMPERARYFSKTVYLYKDRRRDLQSVLKAVHIVGIAYRCVHRHNKPDIQYFLRH